MATLTINGGLPLQRPDNRGERASSAPKSAKSDTARGSMTALFRRGLERVMEAREREARRQIASYLRTMDAETLKRLGYNRDEVTRLMTPRKF